MEAVDDLLLTGPVERTSGVAGGVEAEAGRAKNAPILICDWTKLV